MTETARRLTFQHLTLDIESHREPVDDRILEGGRHGWPVILSSLKSYLETGHPLPKFDMSYLMEGVQEAEKALKENKQEKHG